MGSFPIARRTKVSANPHLVDVFRRPRITGVVSEAMPLQRWELGFRQSSFHRIVRVLRCEALNAFETTTASTTCYCSLRLSPSGKSLTQELSFELLLPVEGILGCAYTAHVRWAEHQYPLEARHVSGGGSKYGRKPASYSVWSTFPSTPIRTGRAAFTASGSPVVYVCFCGLNRP